MAYQWRIRHKLLLGLGLVEGLMGLLLAGTLIGLLSYHWTMKSISSKLSELTAAEKLKETVSHLDHFEPTKGDPALTRLSDGIRQARQDLDVYEEKLNDTIHRRRDRNDGFHERQLIAALHTCLVYLQAEADKRPEGEASLARTDEGDISQYQARVLQLITGLASTATDLRNEIDRELNDSVNDSQRPYHLSMWIVLSTSGVGGLLMMGLLRFFYGWVFHPIRDLEQGVNRVARGDFEHRIEVHSGDEMEELAAAFNDMTNRLRRDVSRPGPPGQRAQPAAGALGTAGQRRLPGGRRGPRDQQPAGQHRLLQRGPGGPAHGCPDPVSQGRRRSSPSTCKMIQEEAFRCKAITAAPAGVQPRRRAPPRVRPTWPN